MRCLTFVKPQSGIQEVSLQGAARSRSEQGIDDRIGLSGTVWVGNRGAACFFPSLVGITGILCLGFVASDKSTGDAKPARKKNSCGCKSVTAVIARSADKHDVSGRGRYRRDFFGQRTSGSSHEFAFSQGVCHAFFKGL